MTPEFSQRLSQSFKLVININIRIGMDFLYFGFSTRN